MIRLMVAVILTASVASAEVKIHRSATAIAEFKRLNPCPATGKHRGTCPGWIVDHVKALACGGADTPENMQWQAKTDARAKDKWERRECGK